MTNPLVAALADDLAQAREEIRKNRESTREKLAELRAATVKTVAQDRSLTVVMGGQGELREIRFNGQHYRKMSPAELASILVETINKAREEVHGKISASTQPWRELAQKRQAAIKDGLVEDKLFGPIARMLFGDDDKPSDE